MDRVILRNLQKIFFSKRITIQEMLSLFLTEDMSEFINIIKEFIEDSYEELLEVDNFFDDYHIFLYDITEKCNNNTEYLYLIKYLINSSIKILKNFNKDYNKNICKKDKYFFITRKILGDLEANLEYLDDYLEDSFELTDFKVIWFIINDLKNPDYLFRILELNPEKANIKDSKNITLFRRLVDNYLANLNNLSDDDIKYYKRVFVLLLESDELYLDNNELITILMDLENNLTHVLKDRKNHISFLINEINQHYSIINGDSRVNAIRNLKTEAPTIIRDTCKYRERIDLTSLFTFSIDTVNDKQLNTLLIDDAFSIVENKDNTYLLYIHVPDVDHFIKKDSETDKFMRSIGESVYKRDYRTQLLNPLISSKMNLQQGNDRAAISFIFKIDQYGNLLDIDFKESIINVNYNLNNVKANMYMHHFDDERLIEALTILSNIVKPLRKKLKNKCNKKGANLIIEEINVFTDIMVAEYMKDACLPFIYKNYLGLRSKHTKEDIVAINNFIKSNDLSQEDINYLYSIFDINNRVYYDNVALPNSSFGGFIATNVGNPLREYISLEACRAIKDMVINKEQNRAYWEERIIRDVVEYTETSAKIRQLYKR